MMAAVEREMERPERKFIPGDLYYLTFRTPAGVLESKTLYAIVGPGEDVRYVKVLVVEQICRFDHRRIRDPGYVTAVAKELLTQKETRYIKHMLLRRFIRFLLALRLMFIPRLYKRYGSEAGFLIIPMWLWYVSNSVMPMYKCVVVQRYGYKGHRVKLFAMFDLDYYTLTGE